MKHIAKHIFTIAAIFALFLVIKVPVHAIRDSSGVDLDGCLRQISCTDTSVTVRWESMQGTDEYDPSISRDVYHYTLKTATLNDKRNFVYDNRYNEEIVSEDDKKYYTFTLKNLPKNHWGKVEMSITYDLYINGEYDHKVSDSVELICNIFTKPQRPTNKQFGIPKNSTVKNMSLKSWIEIKDSKWYYKKQFQICKGNKVIGTYDLSYLNDHAMNLQKGCVYLYRARYYKENYLTGDRIYSNWSSWKGFVVPKTLGFNTYPNKKGLQITLGKIAGVSKYTVYTSLKKKSGFKKAKTFNAKSKKKYTVKITSKYKKGKKNYIKLVPYINLKYYKGPSEFAIVTPRPIKIFK